MPVQPSAATFLARRLKRRSSDWLRPTEWQLAWLSDVVIALALVRVYMWRHLLTTRHELAERERTELVLETQLSLAADIQRRLLPGPATVG